MIIKTAEQVPAELVEMEGASGATIRLSSLRLCVSVSKPMPACP